MPTWYDKATADTLLAQKASTSALTALAPLASPAFTGIPTIGGTPVAKTTDVTTAISNLAPSATTPGRGLDLLEAAPVESDGHSYGLTNTTGANIPRATWLQRLTTRTHAATYVNNNVGGSQAVDTTGRAVGQASVGFRGLILWDSIINDANLRGTAGIPSFTAAVQTWLRIRRASARFEADGYATETGTWTTITDPFASGGTARQTTAQNARHSYTVTGSRDWFVLVAGSVSGTSHGTAVVAVDGTTVATVNLTGIYTTSQLNSSRTWFPYAIPVTVPNTGTHTITVTKSDATTNPVIIDALYAGPVAAPLILMAKGVYPGSGYADPATVDAYNTALDAAAAGIATDGTIATFDPQAAGFQAASMLGDRLHPNNYGAAFIASAAQNTLAQITATAAATIRRGADANDLDTMAAGTATPVTAGGVADNFNRADTTSGLGATSTGGVSWTVISGTWGISSSKAYSVSGGNGDIALVNSGLTDQHVSAAITGDNQAGIITRSDSTASNYYVATASALYVYTGNFSSLGSYGSVQVGDTLELDAVGSTITVKINGSTVLTVTNTAVPTGTYAGFRMSAPSTTTRYDDFAVN